MLNLDVQYMRSPPGIVKLTRLVSVVVACAAFAGVSCNGFYVSVFSIESLVTGFLVFLYVTKLDGKFTWFSWPSVDFLNAVVGVVYMISVCTTAVYHVRTEKMYVAGAFGLVAAVTTAVDGGCLYASVGYKK